MHVDSLRFNLTVNLGIMQMRYLAAYCLLVIGGNATPSAEDVTAVITAAGGEVDEAKLASLIAELEGKDINELLATGQERLKSCANVAASAPAAGEFMIE